MRQFTRIWVLGISALVAAQSAPGAEPETEAEADRIAPAHTEPVALEPQPAAGKLQIDVGHRVRVYVELALAEDVAVPRSLSVGFPSTHKAPHVRAATKVDPSKPFSERVHVEALRPAPEGIPLAALPRCEDRARLLARIDFVLTPTEDAEPLRGITVLLPGDQEPAPPLCIVRADSSPLLLPNARHRKAVVR
jgi:hypothetical protein